LCRPHTYIAKLTLSQSMRLHVVPPFVVCWGCWGWGLYFRCGTLISMCFRVVGSGQRVRRAIKSIFIGFRNVFNRPGTQQDKEYTRVISFRQYSSYITAVRFGPSVELCWPQCFCQCYRIDLAARQPVCTTQRNVKLGGSGSVAMTS